MKLWIAFIAGCIGWGAFYGVVSNYYLIKTSRLLPFWWALSGLPFGMPYMFFLQKVMR